MRKYFDLILILALAAALAAGTAYATHSGPLQQIDGTHTEADGFLPNPILIGGDDGTDIQNIAVDTSGNVQVDIITAPSTTVVDLGTDNDVVATAGLLHGNSPTTEVAILQLIDGSAEGDVTQNEYLASDAITITGSGRLTKLCLVVSGTIVAEVSKVLFFDADPDIAAEVADLTLAEAQTVVAIVDVATADYLIEATSAIACKAIDESFHAITHVVIFHAGATTLANTDIDLHVWYRRDA